MEDIQIFSNPNFGQIRTLTITNEPYFAVEDIARILGYKRPLNSLVRLIDREGETTCMTHASSNGQRIKFTNEQGVFTLIFGINNPMTKRFIRWFVSDILPTMQYRLIIKLEAKNQSLRNENRHLAKALQISAHTISQKDDRIGELRRRLIHTTGEMMLSDSSERLYTVTEIGVMLDMGTDTLNHVLQRMGVQYYKHGIWKLRLHYRNFGYTRVVISYYKPENNKMTKHYTTKWTEKGMRFILQMVGKVDDNCATAKR